MEVLKHEGTSERAAFSRGSRGKLLIVLVAACAGLVLTAHQASTGMPAKLTLSWIEDAFEDFNDGEFDSSGANLYATRSGTVTTVNRFDVNSDGFIDLVFNSSHDEVKIPNAISYEIRVGRRPGKAVALPVAGTSYAAVADLNSDGFLDAVLCPNDDGVNIRRYLSILWGDREGWSARRTTGLITISPRALQVADLNGDGWPEVIVLNGSRWAPEDGPEAVLRIYWGSKEGYRYERFQERLLAAARDLKIQDLDSDNRPDIAVLAPAHALIFWNDGMLPGRELPKPSRVDLKSPSAGKLLIADYDNDGRMDLLASGGTPGLIGFDPTTGEKRFRYSGILVVTRRGRREWAEVLSISAPPASAMAAADLDKDGLTDIILSDSSAEAESVHIIWGERGGHSRARTPTKLPVAYASAVAVGDLDEDGNPDLAVGVSRGKDSWDSNSRVFYGNGKGTFELGSIEIPTADVISVIIAAGADGKGRRLLFCNNRAGRINEDVPVLVYWGALRGPSPNHFSRYSIRSGYASAAADLNDDGYPDLVLLSIVHATEEQHPGLGFNILWGGKDGLRDDRRTVVSEYGLWGLNVADVDRDGYLDLVGNCNKASPAGEPPRVVIWHGGPSGFEAKRRVVIPAPGAEGQNVVADFNKDGYLDIAVARERAHLVTIFWGAAGGYSQSRQFSLPLVAANDIKTADLDRDGWLDLIVTSHRLPNSTFFDFGTYIYWGGPGGFRPTNAQRLPGKSGIGITVTDFDADGYLDIYLPTYHFGVTRESLPSYLYWGGPLGFSDANRTELIVDGAHGSLAADLNADGRTDLAVACHTRNGTHFTKSRVFYNDGSRFTRAEVVELPTIGPHFMQRADVGNLYDRSYRETYVSSVFTWEQSATQGRLRRRAAVPGKSRLEFSMRAAKSREQLMRQPWVDLAASADATFDIPAAARCMQYRAIFLSDNGDRYPVLDRVEVTLSNKAR